MTKLFKRFSGEKRYVVKKLNQNLFYTDTGTEIWTSSKLLAVRFTEDRAKELRHSLLTERNHIKTVLIEV